jgi:hypothetical protein
MGAQIKFEEDNLDEDVDDENSSRTRKDIYCLRPPDQKGVNYGSRFNTMKIVEITSAREFNKSAHPWKIVLEDNIQLNDGYQIVKWYPSNGNTAWFSSAQTIAQCFKNDGKLRIIHNVGEEEANMKRPVTKPLKSKKSRGKVIQDGEDEISDGENEGVDANSEGGGGW